MFIVLRKDHLTLAALLLALVVAVSIFGISYNPKSKIASAVNGKACVILDAGHGGEDPGAVSDNLKICEKDINLVIAKKVQALLEKEGIKVMMTRTEDTLNYPEGTTGYTAKRKADLLTRKATIDSSDASLAVSVHLNKFPQTQYWGAQTFYPHKSPESQKLAEDIQGQIKKTADSQNNRSALVRGKPDDLPIVLFADLKKPTVVVECGFLSNPEDEQRLNSDEYQQKMAVSIKDGILQYLKGN